MRGGEADTTDAPNLPLNDLITLLRPHGNFVYVGVPEEDSIPKLHPFDFIMSESSLSTFNHRCLGASLEGRFLMR